MAKEVGQSYSLLDIDFKNFSASEKRAAFMQLDLTMKRLHEKDLIVYNFEAKNIFYENGLFYFGKICNYKFKFDSKEEAITNNIKDLADLAFCSYLPDYNLSNGLLNKEVINNNFFKFTNIFNAKDQSYYRNVLVDSNILNTIPEPKYYSDYLIKQNEFVDEQNNYNNSSSSNTSSRRKTLATPAGMAYLNDDQAAFSTIFFFVCSIACVLLLIIGTILYVIK